jgi:hypothetical protein
MSGAEERATHPEGEAFNAWFTNLMFRGTESCWERDVLRGNKEALWQTWKAKAAEDSKHDTVNGKVQ